jgi:HAE1 family hydrophobic/amphiphilic exporter-1
VTLSFNLAPGVALGTVVKEIEKITESLNLPSSLSGRFQGQAQAFQVSMQGMDMLLILCILLIYIILGILYESFVHPLTILSGLPAAGFGALLTLMLFGLDLNIYGFVGLIMLVGIVKKNAIMMIDFALEEQRSGKTAEDAIYQGCILRFRPIMMTTLAAITGALPIAFGYGAGGEARQPLGLSVTGGLLVSQAITLYITPVIFLYFERLRNLFKRENKVEKV